MKLTGQASQHWANLETLRELREEHPIGTWRDIKTQLKQKYLTTSYYTRLLDNWNQFYQGNKSTKEYIAKFDKSLIRCSTLETETPMQCSLGLELDCDKILRVDSSPGTSTL